MKIIDFIIISYYIFLRNAKQNQLEVSVFLATIIPILFFSIALIMWFIGYFFEGDIHPVVIAVIMTFLGFKINRVLLKYYLPKLKYIEMTCDKYSKFKIAFIILIISNFIFSIFIFFFAMRFLPFSL